MFISDFYSDEVKGEADAVFSKIMQGANIESLLPFKAKNGKIIPVETRVWTGSWNGNRVIYAMSKDVSLLKETEMRFEKSFMENPAIMAIKDFHTNCYKNVNKAFMSKLGYSKEEVIGKTPEDFDLFCGAQDAQIMREHLYSKSCFSGLEMNIRAKNGAVLTGLFYGEVIETGDSLELLTVMIDITEIKKYSSQIEKEMEERKILLDNIQTQVWYLMDEHTFGMVNEAHAMFHGKKKEEMMYQPVEALFPQELADHCVEINKKVFLTGIEDHSEEWVPDHLGNNRLLSIQKIPVKNASGKVEYVVCSAEDITEKRLAHEKIRSSEEQLKLLISQMQQGLAVHEMIYDENGTPKDYRFISINDSFERITGLKRENLLGKTVLEALPGTESYWIEVYGKVATYGEPIQYENYSSEVDKYFSVSAYSPKKGQFAVILTDITDKKKTLDEIEFLSYHDQLTGLYNRRYFEEVLRKVNEEGTLPLTLIMADVNGLKLTNDAFGHQMGDLLLKKVAQLLLEHCPEDSTLSRIGGDEFVILCPHINEAMTEKWIENFKSSLKNEKLENLILSVSVGYSVKNSEDQTMEEIFKQAEDDMYRHKLSEILSMRSRTIELIMNSLYEKNVREMQHSKRVSDLCKVIAQELGFEKDDVNELKIAGLMHDIGKIGIDERILNNPRKLTTLEKIEVERHCEIGYRILGSVSDFSKISTFVLEHHERWDGSGYPKGLEGNQISLQARIISVADSFDAMTSDRPYRAALTETEAVEEFRRCSGKQFDPEIVKIFIEKVLGKSLD